MPNNTPRKPLQDLSDDIIFEPAEELIGTGTKKGRPTGMARRSLDLIDVMAEIIEAAQPITGRGVGYKLFVRRLIKSMARKDMQRVYRLLKEARERDILPWDWIVDETRGIEQVPTWDDPGEFARSVARQYRRDFWAQQPERCQVWSEKGTVRGVLKPVLDGYGVGFNPVHGFNSATNTYQAATDWDPRPLTILYVGDWDPSGLFMSECDLPARFKKYGGNHITIKRIALTAEQVGSLPSFPASDKSKDPRYQWFVRNYGKRCWEVDAMDPNVLRACVEEEIAACILDHDAWERCTTVEQAERDALRTVLDSWGGAS
jgi:hypothetical protein